MNDDTRQVGFYVEQFLLKNNKLRIPETLVVIISGHGVKRTFGKLLPKQVSEISRLDALCGRLRAVPSMIRLDLELTAPWRKLGIKSQNHMVFPDSEQGVMIFPREPTKIVAAVPLQVVLSDSGWEQEDIDPLGDRLFHTVCKILPGLVPNASSISFQ